MYHLFLSHPLLPYVLDETREFPMVYTTDRRGLLLSLPLELREIVWTQATLVSLSLSRQCCKQIHVEVEKPRHGSSTWIVVFEREAATRRAATAIEGDLQQLAGEEPQPGESGYGWALRTLPDVQNHGLRHRYAYGSPLYVKFCVASPHNSLLYFYTYSDETCGSFKSRVATSAKMMLDDAEVEDWRLLFAGKSLADACKLSVYNIQWGNTVHAVPSSRPLRRRTVKRYSS